MKNSNICRVAIGVLALGVLFSCGKDDEPTIASNTAPAIAAQNFNASEDASDTVVFGKVVATDEDGDTLTFSLKNNSDNLFEISTTGDISLDSGKILDFETTTSHALSVDVSDGELTSNATITINVIDVNENVAPEFLAQTFTIAEDAQPGDTAGTLVATDADGDTLAYSWDPNRNVTEFKLENNIIKTSEVNNQGLLNFEQNSSYTYTVIVSDGVLSTPAAITINVTDVNDAPTLNNTAFTVAEDIDDTFVIGNVSGQDEDGDTLEYVIIDNSLDANGNGIFQIDRTRGDISLVTGRELDFETKISHPITVSVTDSNLSTNTTVVITVTDVDERIYSVSTIAGTTAGNTTAQFNSPVGVAKGPDGNLYVADRLNGAIKTVSPSGVVSVFMDASSSVNGTSPTPQPRDLVFDSNGNLYVSDTQLHSIIKITPSRMVTTFAGRGTAGSIDGSSNTAFNAPHGLAINDIDIIYVADSGNHLIRQITANGTVSTVAGTPGTRGDADGSLSSARFDSPEDVAVASDGSLFVSDGQNALIRKIHFDANPRVSTFLGNDFGGGSVDGIGTNAFLNGPAGLAIDDNDIMYLSSNRNSTIRRIDIAEREIITIAGGVNRQGNLDGNGSDARFNNPIGIWVNPTGTKIFVGDNNNHRIRKITIQ